MGKMGTLEHEKKPGLDPTEVARDDGQREHVADQMVFTSRGPIPLVEGDSGKTLETASERGYRDGGTETGGSQDRHTVLLYTPGGRYAGYSTPQEGVVHGSQRPKQMATRVGVLDGSHITSTYVLNDPNEDRKFEDQLTVHDPQEIELMLDDSGVNGEHGFFEKYEYAYAEGRGGLMDYMQQLRPFGGLHAIRGDRHAYNMYDFGNYVWGMAMQRLGFSHATTIAGSQANALLNGQSQYGEGPRFQLDDPADQRAIDRGHGSTLAEHKPEHLDRGTLGQVRLTRATTEPGGVRVLVMMSASDATRYRDVDVTFPQLGGELHTLSMVGSNAFSGGEVAVSQFIPWSSLPRDGALTFSVQLRGGGESVDARNYRSPKVEGTVDLEQVNGERPKTR